ncbi:MAG: DUF5615 family PIN-like protein [Chloroflexi bacterium]|nr:DUF5615 family PIN-like protein [Chloroflexota bacterium]
MVALLIDENFNNDIVRGLVRRLPSVDLVRVQDVGLAGAADAALLDWAATAGRLIVTHDAATMIDRAYARVDVGLPMPGVIVVGARTSIAQAIDDLLLLVQSSQDQEWAGQIVYVPLG